MVRQKRRYGYIKFGTGSSQNVQVVLVPHCVPHEGSSSEAQNK